MQRVSSHDMHTNGMPDMKRLSLNRNAPQRPGANANAKKDRVVPIKAPLTRGVSPGRRQVPPLPLGARLIDQCIPNCFMPSSSALSSSATDQQLLKPAASASPVATVTKRPNGTIAHLLELPPSVPYAIRLHQASSQGTIHVRRARALEPPRQ